MLTMRKYLLGALSALLFSISSFAEYKPMLVEGRVWEYKGNGSLSSGKVFHHFFKIEGEKEICGQPYKIFKLYLTKEFSSEGTFITEYSRDDVRYVRETGGKVFGISPEYNLESAEIEFDAEKYEQCLYDFTLSEGDSWEYPSVSYHGNSHEGDMNLTVHYDTPMNVNGTEYRVQRFDGLEPLLSEELRFIEGIGTTMYGSLADMTLALISGIWDNSAYPGIQSELVSVKDKDGTILYSKSGPEYVHLLKEGKVWIWNAADHGQRRDDVPVYFTVTGQETMDGRNCFRIKQTSELEYLNGHEYLLCEENRKVEMRFVFEDGHAEFFPLYDFSMKPGEQCQVLEVTHLEVWEPDPSKVMVVKAEEEISACGGLWRKISLEDKGWNDTSVVWVEGIGTRYADQMMTRFHLPEADNGIYLTSFRECIDNGETVFTMADFGQTLSADELPAYEEGCQSDTPTYDIMGRRVTATTRGGIYIRDGKKFIGR